MTRIIGGIAKGRRLQTPPGEGTRPTSDRVREALFSALVAEFGSLDGLAVLDLYAGSGAIGLEAASRGASRVLLVENDRRAAEVISANIATVGAGGSLVVGEVLATLQRGVPRSGAYDVAVLDPPYPLGEAELTEVLAVLVDHGWLVPDAVVVIERSGRSAQPTLPDGLSLWRRKDYGETSLWYVLADARDGDSGGAPS